MQVYDNPIERKLACSDWELLPKVYIHIEREISHPHFDRYVYVYKEIQIDRCIDMWIFRYICIDIHIHKWIYTYA